MSELVKIPEPTKEAAEKERDERGLSSLGAVIEGWRSDAMILREVQTDFKESMQTRGGGDE